MLRRPDSINFSFQQGFDWLFPNCFFTLSSFMRLRPSPPRNIFGMPDHFLHLLGKYLHTCYSVISRPHPRPTWKRDTQIPNFTKDCSCRASDFLPRRRIPHRCFPCFSHIFLSLPRPNNSADRRGIRSAHRQDQPTNITLVTCVHCKQYSTPFRFRRCSVRERQVQIGQKSATAMCITGLVKKLEFVVQMVSALRRMTLCIELSAQ